MAARTIPRGLFIFSKKQFKNINHLFKQENFPQTALFFFFRNKIEFLYVIISKKIRRDFMKKLLSSMLILTLSFNSFGANCSAASEASEKIRQINDNLAQIKNKTFGETNKEI